MNEITQHTKPNQWNYVPTELNPVDHGTRGLKPLDISSKWTKGPDFLLKPVKYWPSRMPANLDMSICTATVVVSQTGLVDISRFSSWNRLLKTTAIVRFFIRRLRDPSSTPNLTANDFQLATETLLRQSQLVSFPAVLGKLLRKESLSSKDKLLPLNPFIDERQIIRSSGRLQYPPLPAATRMPVGSRCPERNNPPHHGTLSRNLPPRRSRIRQDISATTLFRFCRPCRPAHHQLSLLPMPPLSRRKHRANDGALTPMPIFHPQIRHIRSRMDHSSLSTENKLRNTTA